MSYTLLLVIHVDSPPTGISFGMSFYDKNPYNNLKYF